MMSLRFGALLSFFDLVRGIYAVMGRYLGQDRRVETMLRPQSATVA